MRTEADLRAALLELADAEPAAVDRAAVPAAANVVALAPSVPPRRRRWLAPAAASVAVVAAVVIVAVVAGAGWSRRLDGSAHHGTPSLQAQGWDPARPCASSADPRITGLVTHSNPAVNFSVFSTCGNGVREVDATVGNAGADAIGLVYLPAGMFSTDQLAGAQRVSADGIDGWAVKDIVYEQCLSSLVRPCTLTDGLVWEYAPDAYAIGYAGRLNQSEPITQDAADRIALGAKQVDPSAGPPVGTPATFGYLPDALHPFYAAVTTPQLPDKVTKQSCAANQSCPDVHSATPLFGDVQFGLLGVGPNCAADAMCKDAVDINFDYDLQQHPAEAVIDPTVSDTVLRGTCGHFTFDATAQDPITADQLRQIVLGMRCASSADTSTWTPITG